MLFPLFLGLALGFSLTIPPGPMNALIASEATFSWNRGVVTGLGAMSADIVLAALIYAIHNILSISTYARWIELTGAAVIAYFGASGLRATEERPARSQGKYFRALLFGISNPFQILWWITAGLAFAYIGGLILLVGLFLAVAVWILIFPALIRAATRKHPKVEEGVRLLSSGIMFAFAAYLVYLFIQSA
ncbi:MAG: LysE family transporter [Methanomassiliicoccales archaeon]